MTISTEPVLRIAGLGVTYGGLRAVDDLSFEVAHGQIFGLIGPNGAGKTSLIDAVTGYTPISAGRVLLDGRDISAEPPHRRARSGLARTFQSVELFDDLTVAENLAVASAPVTLRTTAWEVLFGRRNRDQVAIDSAIDWCGLGPVADRYPAELSHGQRKLVGVARALASQPTVVMLDEPAAGLDSDESAQLGEQLRQLPPRGVSVVLVDHDMSLVLAICDEIMVLDFGRGIARGTPTEVRENPAVIDAYLGTP